MGIIIDLIAIVFLIVSALIAYYKGFVKTFFGFISVILAILLACCFSKPLANHMKASTEMDEWIASGITEIGKKEEEPEYTILSGESISGEIVIEEEPVEEEDEINLEIIGFIENLPDSVSDVIDFEEQKNATLLNIANKVSDGVIGILAWVIIYFVVRIIFAVITVIFDGIMNIPILKSINNLAGLVIGVVLGVFRIYLLLAIIYFISNVTSITFFVNIIQNSSIVNAMYNNNLIINLIF